MKFNFYKTRYALIIFFLIGLFNIQTNSQDKADIFILGGYFISSSVQADLGEIEFNDTYTGTLGLDIPVDRHMSAEISWSMTKSKASLDQYLGGTIDITDLYIHQFQAGALIEPKKNEKVSPYGSFTLGASLFLPTKDYDEQWRFSIALAGGVKVNVSEKFGLRFQARLIVPMQFAGTSVWFGTGGTGVSLGAYTTFVEADFTGGLYFRL